MAEYAVAFARSARKELERLPSAIADRVIGKVESLLANPRPPGSLKLHGSKNRWRIRIGDYRVIYAIDDVAHTIDVSAIRHRREAYKDS